jgi:hypothetical protein
MAPPAGIAAGTAVDTPAGPVPVQALRPGDRVTTVNGAERTIARTTHRHFAADMLAYSPDAGPIRIRAGALGESCPQRDVLVAPGQLVAAEGVSALAHTLVNAASVRRDATDRPVIYIVLSLDGPPDGADVIAVGGIGCACSGLPDSHAATAALQIRLDAHTALAPGALRGDIAGCDHEGASGWALDATTPTAPVRLEILVDGIPLARTRADLRRPDLEMAGLGDGRCGFAVRFAPALPRNRAHIVQIRRAGDGAELPGSPLLLPHAKGDGTPPTETLDRAVAAASSDAERDALALFLADGIGRMAQALIIGEPEGTP